MSSRSNYKVNPVNFKRVLYYCKFNKLLNLDNNPVVNKILESSSNVISKENIAQVIRSIVSCQNEIKDKSKHLFEINNQDGSVYFRHSIALEKQSHIQPIKLENSYTLVVEMEEDYIEITVYTAEKKEIFIRFQVDAHNGTARFSHMLIVPMSEAVYILNSLFRRINTLFSATTDDKEFLNKINSQFAITLNMRSDPRGLIKLVAESKESKNAFIV